MKRGLYVSRHLRFPAVSRPWSRMFLALVLGGAVATCDPDDLLDVEYPDYITEESVGNAAGALAFYNRAIGDFAWMTNGAYNLVIGGGLMSDELASGRPALDFFDNRDYQNNRDLSSTSWSRLHNQSIRAADAMNELLPEGEDKSTKVGHMHMLDGMGMTLLAEHYCNGIPFGSVVDGELAFEETPLSYNQVFERAITAFDAALAVLPGSAMEHRNFAMVGKARALLDLDRPTEAAAVAASVPTNFLWQVEFASGAITNGLHDWIEASGNFTPTHREGNGNYDREDGTGQGLPYIWGGDPRVRIETPNFRVAQDGGTRVYRILDHTTATSPVTAASGIEARLIEAEADLRSGGSTWLTILNTLRSTMITPPMEELADPGSTDARVDLLFEERAYWMYLTAHRLGDMRRLVRQHGRNITDVFPSGAYFKGGSYGSSVVFQFRDSEQTRPEGAPEYTGCTNLDI